MTKNNSIAGSEIDQKYSLIVSIISRFGDFPEMSSAITAALKDVALYSKSEHSFLGLFDDKKQSSKDFYQYSEKPLPVV